MDDGLPARLTRLTRQLLNQSSGPGRVIENALHDLTQRLSPSRPTARPAMAGSVSKITDFGANPGALRMLHYLPVVAPRPGAPLLVLLHGCGQDAALFARATGFMALADRIGAPLLLPDQQSANNHGRCFNWFEPADVRRGGGEAASIAQMVAADLKRFRGDASRVFVAGLSAGGAMAAALLAAYPDVFAAGAVVAGLPVGAATDVRSAFARMKSAGTETWGDWAGRATLAHAGGIAWPRVPRLSVWSGNADHTVDPTNSDALVAQWTALHGLKETPDRDEEAAPGIRRLAWGNAVEQWRIAGFGHAFPARTGGLDPYVQPALVAGVDAIARFWGLSPAS